MSNDFEPIVVELGQNPLNLNMNQIDILTDELLDYKSRALKNLQADQDLFECFSLAKVAITINEYEYSLEVLQSLKENGEVK
ncbi:hypothetical protein F971_01510 [Acinetobacter vivianii]|uniref:Uncharacterized protein n=1 Tax=Acinetobacter vivianii TaxID=1776742 RepID=N8W6P0_9GAMM|nr:hypothetical protein [Acinetobacter vivianii]ENU92528.1 hypothetical protein F971_01510 [Acinetobacter vivianii]